MKIQKVYKITCVQCGKPFFAKRADAKFDKPACQMAHYRASHEYRQKQLAAEYEKQQASEQKPQSTETTEEETQQ